MDNQQLSSIHPSATIGENVTIGPFCFIDADVVIEDGALIGPRVTLFSGSRVRKNAQIHAGSVISGTSQDLKYPCEPMTTEIGEGSLIGPGVSILQGSRLGKRVQVHTGAVIGGSPQDLKYRGEPTTAEIGDDTVIREYVTVNRGTTYANRTVVGKNCLLMAYVHVAHDCIIGHNVILANNVNLAGHVMLEDHVILEGLVAVQQFIKIGEHSFVAGGSLVRKHVPPYVKAAREPLAYAGINAIGMRRRHFSEEQIEHIREIYHALYGKGRSIRNAVRDIKDSFEHTKEVVRILNFIEENGSIMRGYQFMNNPADVATD